MRKKGIFNEIFRVVRSNLISLIFQVILGIILANKLGPDGTGLYATIMVVPMLAGTIAKLGVKRSTIYHLGKKIYPEKEIISSLFYLAIFISVLWMIFSYFSFYFVESADRNLPLIMIVLAMIPFSLIVNFSVGVFVGKRMMKKFNIFQWLPDLMELVFILIFVSFVGLDVKKALYALLLANIVLSVYAIYLINKYIEISFKFYPRIVLAMLKLGLVFAASLLVLKLHYRIDILLLERLSGVKEVGLYSLAARFAQKWQVPFTVGAVIVSRSANTVNLGRLQENINKLLRLSFLGGILASIILYFIAPYVIPLLYGARFTDSIVMIQAILPGILMLIVINTLSNYFAGQGNAWKIFLINAISLVINVMLNLWWIPFWGGIGAAMATNASYGFAAILFLFYYAKMSSQPVKKVVWYQKSDFDMIFKFRKFMKNETLMELPQDHEL
jgi:O-antigen/teichoic acid export membrane protein